MDGVRCRRRAALGLAATLATAGLPAQQPLRLVGRSHWLLDRDGRLSVSLSATGTRAAKTPEIDLGLRGPLVWSCDDWPIVTCSGPAGRARLVALADPDLLVVELAGRDRPFSVHWQHPTTTSRSGSALLELGGGHGLAVQATGGRAAGRSIGGGMQLPAAGGYLCLAAGRDPLELERRLRAVTPALPELFAIVSARFAMRVHDGWRPRTGQSRLDGLLVAAQRQLLACADAEGRLWDQRGPRSVAPPPGAAIDAAAALWSCGLIASSGRILDAAAAAVGPAELQLLQARARLWRSAGRLGAPAAWEQRSSQVAEPKLDRQLETGYAQPRALVPDLVELAVGHGAAPPERDGAWFADGDRLLLATDPFDERLACWHLWLGARVFDLPPSWQDAVARTAPQVVAKLLQRDGTLALRTSVGRSSVPGGDVRPAPVATALLALWRLEREDRDGAWRALLAIATRQATSNEPWLPWAWQDPQAPSSPASCHVSVASAALVLLAACELFGRPSGGRGSDEADRVPGGAEPVWRAVDAPAAPPKLPAMLEHLVLGGPVYQRRFTETVALVRHLAATQLEIVRTRRTPSPEEEQRAIADLLRLGAAIESAFEASLRR